MISILIDCVRRGKELLILENCKRQNHLIYFPQPSSAEWSTALQNVSNCPEFNELGVAAMIQHSSPGPLLPAALALRQITSCEVFFQDGELWRSIEVPKCVCSPFLYSLPRASISIWRRRCNSPYHWPCNRNHGNLCLLGGVCKKATRNLTFLAAVWN